MKILSILFYFLLQDIFPVIPATGIVYYVMPTSPNTTNCPGQPCQTLQYYFENVDTAVNNQKNVTMIFMSGTHTTSVGFVFITVPIINMTGEGQGVLLNTSSNGDMVEISSLSFDSFTEVSLSNIVTINWEFMIMNADTPLTSRFMMSSVKMYGSGYIELLTDANFRFDSCEFYGTTWSTSMDRVSVTMENCTLTRNYLQYGIVDASGVSQLTDTNQSLAKSTKILETSIFMMSSVKIYQSMLEIQISSIYTSLIFDSCEFYNCYSDDGPLSMITITGASATMENCKLVRNPLIIIYSTIVFSGVSQLTGTNQSSAITSYFSNITLSGEVIFANNSGVRGGAMALFSSTLNVAPGTNASFINNSAEETGGAVFIHPSLTPDQLLFSSQDILPETAPVDLLPQCFYQLLNCSAGASYTFFFASNSAVNGGDDIYGASLQFHQSIGNCNLTVNRNNYTGMSSVSSDPTRVCLCDSKGTPQCKIDSYIIVKNYGVYPGEMFTISAILVGGDFGATGGPVYVDCSSTPCLTSTLQYSQVINNVTHCSNLTYSLYSNEDEGAHMCLTTIYNIINVNAPSARNMQYIFDYRDDIYLHTAPVCLNITLLACPPGFTLTGEPPICDCSPVLTDDVKCEIIDKRGLFSWNSSLWANVDEDSIAYNRYCPLNYCNAKNQQIDLKDDSDTQCAFNRAGRLCGGCKDNYSLAIGSSHCIHCPNNNNLALLIFFAAAGFLLVFFISAFNLTVTQGMINGLIFYANIVWAHQGLLFPHQTEANAGTLMLVAIGKTFIAWLNLDFGIQTCFFDGLNAFWKTWLQYLFPFYTAGLFFIGLRYSSKLSKLFGSRSVPTLATLLFLSYTKLLRTIITSLELSRLTKYPNDTSYYIWSIDGRLKYGQFPHITLLLMAIGCLLILWLPYTLLLLLMQWLRRIQNFTVSKWITRYKPVFDAYFAPLKDKHHYWFGVLLLSRGILLLASSLTANINPAVSPFLLLCMAILLLCYMSFHQVYKRKSVLILESVFLINLIILTGGAMYYRDSNSSEKATLICLSISIAFIKFCGIVIWSILQAFPCCLRCQRRQAQYENIEPDENAQLFQGREIIQENDELCDSILNDTQLLPTY